MLKNNNYNFLPISCPEFHSAIHSIITSSSLN